MEANIAKIVLLVGLGIVLAIMLYFAWVNIRQDLAVSSGAQGA